jgi:hypothetical protein
MVALYGSWVRLTGALDICGSIMQGDALGDRYVDFANHCLQLAATTADEQSRRILREMAASWLELAEVALAGWRVSR